MKFRGTQYGGTRPVFTAQPIMVAGGFNLDTSVHVVTAGSVIAAGTLATYDEETRLVKINKTGRVVSIDVTNHIIELESNLFLKPIFTVGERLVGSGSFDDLPQIVKIVDTEHGYWLHLTNVDGLSVGDVVQHGIDVDGETQIVVERPNALVIKDTVVGLDEIGIDITVDTGAGAVYERRIPPIPYGTVICGVLEMNHNIKFSKSM